MEPITPQTPGDRPPGDLRQYLEVTRRQWHVIVAAVVLLGVGAGVVSALRTPEYRATARILLRTSDGADEVLRDQRPVGDPERFQAVQADVIRSEAVARAAAESLGKGVTAGEVRGAITVGTSSATDAMSISATDLDPVRARDIANAVTTAYIENRRQNAVAGLQRVADELEGRLQESLARIAEYDSQLAAQGEEAAPTDPGAPPPASDEGIRAARYAAAVQYQELYRQQQQVLVDLNLTRGPAELLEEAGTPTAPVNKSTARDAVLGAVVGLLLGVGIALLREQLDDRLRGRDDIDALTQLPILAELPVDRDSEARPTVATATKPGGAMAEAVRSLRTSVALTGIDEPVKRLLITSPSPGDGKSLVAANLAVAYAQAGFITVLVSADLRRPRVEQMFELAPVKHQGITWLMEDLPASSPRAANEPAANGRSKRATLVAQRREALVGRALVATGVPNLLVLPAGPSPPNPAEVLASRRMGEILDELAVSCEILVLDSPPVLAVTDAVVLASRVDAVALVASLDQTERRPLQRATEILTAPGIRLIGCVLNRSKSRGRYYSGGYAYSYYSDGSNGAAGRTPLAERGSGRG